MPWFIRNAVSGHADGPLDQEVVLGLAVLVPVDVDQRKAEHVDDALHDVLDRPDRNVGRVLENDDLAAARRAEPGQLGDARKQLGAVDQLVHEDPVPDEQGIDHGLRGIW